MTTFYSDNLAGTQTVPRGTAGAQRGGVPHVQCIRFVAASAVAAADDVVLCRLPKGAIPLGGVLNVSAIATGGIMQVGKTGGLTDYAVETSANALQAPLFPTYAKGHGIELTTPLDLLLTLKAGSAGFAQGTVLTGYVLYHMAQ